MDYLIYVLFFLLGFFINELFVELMRSKGTVYVYKNDDGDPMLFLSIKKVEDISTKHRVMLNVKKERSQK